MFALVVRHAGLRGLLLYLTLGRVDICVFLGRLPDRSFLLGLAYVSFLVSCAALSVPASCGGAILPNYSRMVCLFAVIGPKWVWVGCSFCLALGSGPVSATKFISH